MSTLVLALVLGGCSEYGVNKESDDGPERFEVEADLDVDGDGIPDLNIDLDGDGVPDVDIDTDGDGVPDINIDTDGDGIPDLNIDLDGDGFPDLNIDINDDLVPELNIDTDGDLIPDMNIDVDDDGVPDLNIDIYEEPDEPDEPIEYPSTVVEQYFVPEIADVDLVFFGDTSGSMDEELAQIGSRITEFTNRLDAGGGNWQLISVNGDNGCATDTIFTPDTPDWATRFADAVLTAPNNSDTNEQGLITVAEAVSRTGPGQCNEGFIRENALLHAVFLSDENDESPGFDSGDPDYWQQYVDTVIDAKNGVQGLVRFSAITGATPDGCNGSDPGFGYVEAMQGTGGTFLSICDPWETQLDVIADASLVLEAFPLADQPDPSTIFVLVNNQPRPPSDWEYEPVTNSVRFVFNPPDVNSLVRVGYTPL